MDEPTARAAIERMERHINGFDKLSGATVKVNITAMGPDKVIADVTLSSSEDGPEEVYRDIIYHIPTLNKWKGGEKKMSQNDRSVLVGYARKSKAGGALRLSIDTEAFAKAETFEAKDGKKFVSLVINADKVSQILSGEREVTSICQLNDSE